MKLRWDAVGEGKEGAADREKEREAGIKRGKERERALERYL